MPRKPNIKWRASDAEKLNKEIKRFNAKIYRTRKAHPEIADTLPKTILKADKEKMIAELKNAPRSEFKKEVNSLARFSTRGAEKPIKAESGNTVTAWEKREVGLKVGQINRARTLERKRISEIEATSRGVKTGLKRGEMGSVRMNELRPKKYNFDKIQGGKEWEKYKESVYRQASANAKYEKAELYKANYIKGLKNAFGDYSGDVISIIEQIPAEEVVETYFKEQEATIDFVYDPFDAHMRLDIITDIWRGALDDYEEFRR